MSSFPPCLVSNSLSSLQSQSLLQLPATEEDDLIDPNTFKVFNEEVNIIHCVIRINCIPCLRCVPDDTRIGPEPPSL